MTPPPSEFSLSLQDAADLPFLALTHPVVVLSLLGAAALSAALWATWPHLPRLRRRPTPSALLPLAALSASLALALWGLPFLKEARYRYGTLEYAAQQQYRAQRQGDRALLNDPGQIGSVTYRVTTSEGRFDITATGGDAVCTYTALRWPGQVDVELRSDTRVLRPRATWEVAQPLTSPLKRVWQVLGCRAEQYGNGRQRAYAEVSLLPLSAPSTLRGDVQAEGVQPGRKMDAGRRLWLTDHPPQH